MVSKQSAVIKLSNKRTIVTVHYMRKMIKMYNPKFTTNETSAIWKKTTSCKPLSRRYEFDSSQGQFVVWTCVLIVWLLPVGQGGFRVHRACLVNGHMYWLSTTSTALVGRIYDRNLLGKSEESWKFQMTVNDLLSVYLFFLVHAVKLRIEQHYFLTVFGCQNVIGYASALTTT